MEFGVLSAIPWIHSLQSASCKLQAARAVIKFYAVRVELAALGHHWDMILLGV